jgi:hypothetical protein
MRFTLGRQDAATSSEPVPRAYLDAAEVRSSDVKLCYQYFHNQILSEHQARAQCNLYFTEDSMQYIRVNGSHGKCQRGSISSQQTTSDRDSDFRA